MNTKKTKADLSGIQNLNTRRTAAEKPVQAVSDGAGGKGKESQQPPSRRNAVHVGGYFPPEVRTQLKMIGLEQDKTVQQLMGEALNGLFVTYGKAEIAPTEKN